MSVFDVLSKVCPLLTLAQATQGAGAGAGLNTDNQRRCIGDSCAWYREGTYEYTDNSYREVSYCGLAGKPEDSEDA